MHDVYVEQMKVSIGPPPLQKKSVTIFGTLRLTKSPRPELVIKWVLIGILPGAGDLGSLAAAAAATVSKRLVSLNPNSLNH